MLANAHLLFFQPKDDANWNVDWDVDGNRKPSTIQEHIEYYRETKQKAAHPEVDKTEDENLNFFQVRSFT